MDDSPCCASHVRPGGVALVDKGAHMMRSSGLEFSSGQEWWEVPGMPDDQSHWSEVPQVSRLRAARLELWSLLHVSPRCLYPQTLTPQHGAPAQAWAASSCLEPGP